MQQLALVIRTNDVFDQVTDNPGTSVQPWLNEDLKSSCSFVPARHVSKPNRLVI